MVRISSCLTSCTRDMPKPAAGSSMLPEMSITKTTRTDRTSMPKKRGSGMGGRNPRQERPLPPSESPGSQTSRSLAHHLAQSSATRMFCPVSWYSACRATRPYSGDIFSAAGRIPTSAVTALLKGLPPRARAARIARA